MTSSHDTPNIVPPRPGEKDKIMTQSRNHPTRVSKKRLRPSARQALLPLGHGLKTLQTQRSKAVFQLKTELNRLQTRDREWKSMFQMLSHDLKEPILTLEGFSKLLTETELTKDQTRYVSIVRDAVNTLHQLVGSLQSVARLSQAPQEFTEFSLKELLESVVINLSNHIARTHGEVILPEQDLLIRGDPIRLFQILMNLIANSLKYHKKGENPLIKISHKKEAKEIRISIADNGIGMTSKELQRIFVPFTRLKELNVEGMGLGLSIVKRIAESLRGRVLVKSKPEIGTTITLCLPRFPDEGLRGKNA